MDDMKARAEKLRAMCGDPSTDPRELLGAAFELLGQLSARLDEQAAEAKETRAFVEQIDEDLADLEDAFFEDAEDPEDKEPDGAAEEPEEPEEFDETELIRYACPHCGKETVFRVESIDLEDAPRCAGCGELLFPGLE